MLREDGKSEIDRTSGQFTRLQADKLLGNLLELDERTDTGSDRDTTKKEHSRGVTERS